MNLMPQRNIFALSKLKGKQNIRFKIFVSSPKFPVKQTEREIEIERLTAIDVGRRRIGSHEKKERARSWGWASVEVERSVHRGLMWVILAGTVELSRQNISATDGAPWGFV